MGPKKIEEKKSGEASKAQGSAEEEKQQNEVLLDLWSRNSNIAGDDHYQRFYLDIEGLVNVIGGQEPTKEQKLLRIQHYLSDPTIKFLPFPSIKREILRFHYPLQNGLSHFFRCFGVSRLNDFIRWRDENFQIDASSILYGTIGSGKSHLLACYVIYMYCKLYLDLEGGESGFIMPVYVSSSRNLFDTGFREFMNGFCFSLKFCANKEALSSSSAAAHQVSTIYADILDAAIPLATTTKHLDLAAVDDFLAANAILFRNTTMIFDDWNALAYPPENRYHLVQPLYYGCKRLSQLSCYPIIALSARSNDNLIKVTSNDVFFVTGGLQTDQEWEALCSIHKNVIENMLVASIPVGKNPMNSLQAKTIMNELAFISGKIPLIVRDILKINTSLPMNVSWEERKRLYFESDCIGAGGAWIQSQLRNFLRSVDSEMIGEVVEILTQAISETGFIGGARIDTTFYDRRFFMVVKTVSKSLLVSTCGAVNVLAIPLLYKMDQDMLLKTIDDGWCNAALLSNANPTVKGFAYETYVIKEILKRLSRMIPELDGVKQQHVKVAFFDGDFPSPTVVRDYSKPEIGSFTLFWPNKFNCRRIDAMLRYVRSVEVDDSLKEEQVTIMAEDEGRQTRSKVRRISDESPPQQSKKKKKTQGTKSQTLFLPVQITLSSPNDHQDSLKFFSQPYDNENMCDCERYITAIDTNIKFVFYWIVPHAQVPTDGILPTLPTCQYAAVVSQKVLGFDPPQPPKKT